MMPPYLPWPLALVQMSGIAEILGGLGVLFRPTQRAAAWGLILLLVAVFPANLQIALHGWPGMNVPSWALWARLPFQIVFIWGIHRLYLRRPTKGVPFRPLEESTLTLAKVAALIGLLVFPLLALFTELRARKLELFMLAPLGISLMSYFLCLADKRRAQSGQWRISERLLHILELLGGWPGSFVAQRQFRHKVSKRSYQITFWIIVALYQIVAVDALRGWPWATAISKPTHRSVESRRVYIELSLR